MDKGLQKYKLTRRTIQLTVILILLTPGFGFAFFEGSLIASKLFGIPLLDPLAFVEYLLASKSLYLSSVTGVLIATVIYFLLKGRTFCSYACPIHLISETTASLHKRFKLFDKKIDLTVKYYILGIVLFLSAVLSLPFFTSFSPIGTISRAVSSVVKLNLDSDSFADISVVSFSLDVSLLIILMIVLIEIFVSKNIWCRSLCPAGAFYALLGKKSLMTVKIDHDKCVECDDCFNVCMVDEVLNDPVLNEKDYVLDGSCSNCFNCIDSCPEDALSISFNFKRENKK